MKKIFILLFSLDDAEWAMLVKELEWIRKEEAKKNRF